jgi:exosortase/archaeosortase family protein
LRKKRKKKFKIDKRKMITIIWFLIRFNLFAIPLYILLYINFSFLPLQRFLAYVSYKTLTSLGYKVSLKDIFLIVPRGLEALSIGISWDSTGWKSIYTLMALVLATPYQSLYKKSKFLLISIPSLFFLNFLRIITTILVAVNFGFNYFEIVHTFLWREGLIFAVVAIWYLWLRQIMS